MGEEKIDNQGGQSDQSDQTQTGSITWRDAYPDYKDEKSLDVYKGKDEKEVFPLILKSLVNAEKMIGGSLRIPKEGAKPEEVEAFRNKAYAALGRPEKPEDYKYIIPNVEYLPWDTERITDFKTRLHKLGATDSIIQEAINFEGERMLAEYESQKRTYEEGSTQLKEEWGGAFDRNLALAKRARDEFGGEALREYYASDPRGKIEGNHPAVIKAWARVGAMADEGGYLGGPGESAGLSPDEAKAKIVEIMANKDDLYHAKFVGKPGHEERVKEVQALYDLAYRTV